MHIDVLKHLFCLLVIFQHMSSSSRYTYETDVLIKKISLLIDFSVIGFFFISGYLFKLENTIKFTEYIWHQFKRLMIPFFLFSIIYAIVLSSLGKVAFLDCCQNILFMRGVGPHLYFLPYLFATTIFNFAITLYFNGYKKINVFLMLSAAVSVSLMPTESATGPDMRLIPLYALAFLLGREMNERFEKRYLAFAIALTILASLGLYDGRFIKIAIVMILFLISESIFNKMPQRRIYGSGGTYLLHTPILNFFISTVLLSLGITQMVNVIASIMATYISCLFLVWVIKRKAQKISWIILE